MAIDYVKARGHASAFAGTLFLLAIFAITPARASEGTKLSGAALYNLYCASCHAVNLKGSDAPSLRDIGRMKLDFHLTTGRMPPDRAPLPPEQINAIVNYVMTRSTGSTSAVHIDDRGDIQRGRALFIANCSACHGATATGSAIGYGLRAPNLSSATLVQVAQAMRIGPDGMPVFDRFTLTDHQVNDIVQYVKMLQGTTPAAGGITLGNIGAVGEGLIAWILGLGLILIVTRFVGSSD
jgi:ubiquinol-cytochrome c reductase cytochrome c subunit